MAPFELVMKDPALQENWFRRIVAIIIDGILIGIVYGILWLLFFAGYVLTRGIAGVRYGFNGAGLFGFGVLSFILMIIWIVYFAVMESVWGASVGKMLLSLRVVGEDGKKPLINNAFIRNLSRIWWPLFLLDVIGGLVMEGDPRQRFSDRYAKTVVYHKGSSRGGPFAEPRILAAGEASSSATAGRGAQAPSAAAPSEPEGQAQGKPVEGKPVEEKPAKEKAPEAAAGEEKAFCPYCGAPVKPGSQFCSKCGKKL